jgi:hypothetical protein
MDTSYPYGTVVSRAVFPNHIVQYSQSKTQSYSHYTWISSKSASVCRITLSGSVHANSRTVDKLLLQGPFLVYLPQWTYISFQCHAKPVPRSNFQRQPVDISCGMFPKVQPHQTCHDTLQWASFTPSVFHTVFLKDHFLNSIDIDHEIAIQGVISTVRCRI